MAEVANRSDSDEREILRQSIDRNYAELREAIDELKSAARNQFTLREWIAEYHTPWLIVGFLFGLWLAARYDDRSGRPPD